MRRDGPAGGAVGSAETQAPAAGGVRFRTFRSLRYRDYRILWFSITLSGMGQWMELIAVGWLLWTLTHSEFLAATVLAVRAVPSLFAPIGGVMADRFDRRRLLIVSQLVALAITLLLTTLLFLDRLHVAVLYLLMVLGGTAWTVNNATRQTVLANLVPREDLMNAVALQTTAFQMTNMLGAAGAGALIAAFDVRGVYVFICLLYAAVTVLTVSLRVPPVESNAREASPLANIREGFAYLRSNRPLASLMLLYIFPIVFGIPIISLMPVFADKILGAGSLGLGLLNASYAFGATIAVLVIATLKPEVAKGRLILGAAALMSVGIVLFALSTWLAMSMLMLVIVGAGRMGFATMVSSTVQMAVPEALRGRVVSALQLEWGLTPLGNVLAGALAQVWTAPISVVLMGCISGASVLFGWLRLPSIRRMV